MDLYQILALIEQKEQRLVANGSALPLMFNSLAEAKAILKKVKARNCFLQHHIAYGEMVGEKDDGHKGDLMPIHIS